MKKEFDLTLALPSSNYYTSPLSLSARNLQPLFPDISFVFCVILPSEVKFYPQTGSPQSRFCRLLVRVFYGTPPSRRVKIVLFFTAFCVCIGMIT